MISLEQIQQFLKEHWNDLVPLILVPSAVPLLYANPWIFGLIVLALGLGLLFLIVLSKKSQQHKRLLLFAVSIVLVGLVFINYSDSIRPVLLDNIYGLTLNPRTKLNEQTRAAVKDNPTLWPITLSQTNRIINIADKGQTELDALFSSSEGGQLFFLTGPAGTGKTPLLRQWVHRLSAEGRFGNTFLISLSGQRKFLSHNNPSLSELVAYVYRTVISSAGYYDLLFASRPCLIVLDDLDEIDSGSANNILTAAYNLVSATSCKVVIGSRPEGVLLSHYYQTFLRWTSVTVLGIEPLDDAQRKYIVNDRLPAGSSDDRTTKLTKLLESRPAIKEMATQLDYLNGIIDHIDEYASESDLVVIERLVEARKHRNIESHWKGANINPDDRMAALYRLALSMSRDDKFESRDDKLNLSGFATVIGDEYHFSPQILQSYFAFKGLKLTLALQQGDDPMSETLLKDLAKFDSLDSDLVELVKRSFKKNPPRYYRSINQVRKITGDQFVLDTLVESHLSQRDLISKLVFAR